MTEAPVIQCSKVTKRFGEVLAAAGVSFNLARAEVLAVLGPSGCGKTTLLRLIAGFESVDAGEIFIRGRLVSNLAVHVPPEQRNVGMVFQEYALFPHLTVAENVSFGLQRMPGQERRRRLAEVMELVRLTGLERRYPHELSGGQQQRVALARTLAPRPLAVLLDEPFSNLDASMRTEMRKEVEVILRASATATIFVTHDREEAFAMADRVAVMGDGRLEQLDSPDAIYHRPASAFVARLAGACDLIAGEFRGGVAVTELGRLPCASTNGPVPEGAAIDVMVRPDDLDVVLDASGDAIVVSREFRGGETVLAVRSASGTVLQCRQLSYSEVRPGARVRLSAKPGRTFVAFKKSTPRPL